MRSTFFKFTLVKLIYMKKGTVSRVFSLCLYTSKHNFQINLVPLSGIRSQCPISVTPAKSYDIKSLSINTAVTRSGGLVLGTLARKKPTFVWLLKTLKGKPPSCATKHFFPPPNYLVVTKNSLKVSLHSIFSLR